MVKKYRKEILTYTSIALCLIFILLYFLFISNAKRVKEIDLDDYVIVNRNNYICNVKKVEDNDKFIAIEGYIYNEYEKIEKSSICFVLYNIQEKEAYKFPTYVKNMLNNGIDEDHSWSGYKTYTEKSKIDTNDDYKAYLLIEFNDEEKLVDLDVEYKDIIK